MPPFIDLTGMRFGSLTVIERSGYKDVCITWACRCDCGNLTIVQGKTLRSGLTKSCGCSRIKLAICVGGVRTPEYAAYYAARDRCTNMKNPDWENYGGRGIQFKFNSYEEFINHVGKKPRKGYSLDRINNDGNYEFGNIRWANKTLQFYNRRAKMVDQFSTEELQKELFKRLPDSGWWSLC